MYTLYTIGHSSHPYAHFLQLLKAYDINCIIDIRTVPYSKWVPHFNREIIKESLRRDGIYHIYMAEEFGAIRTDRKLLTQEGYVDFFKIQETESFKSGIQRTLFGLEKGYRVAVMCTEKDPIDCHRSIMLAPEFIKSSCKVEHILENSTLQCHRMLEDRLLEMYFPENPQENLFHLLEDPLSREELLVKCYKLRNKEIGYRP